MQARQHGQAAAELDGQAAAHRAQRDHLVRTLRAEDPVKWTYRALARDVGCSPELIAKIVQGHRCPG
jgi:hypothetical protein